MVNPNVVSAVELSVSPNQADVQKGAAQLSELLETQQADTIQTLCEILTSAQAQNSTTQIGAALFLKNVIKRRWDMEAGLDQQVRQMMRKALVPLLCAVPSRIRAILMDVLEVMVATDFPMDWDTLLPSLMNEHYIPFLRANATANADCDLTQISVIVDILHGALKKYEDAFKEDQILRELKIILAQSQEAIFGMLQWSSAMYKHVVEAAAAGPENESVSNGRGPRALMLSQIATQSLLAVKALHGVDLPEYFEDNLKPLMQICCQALTLPPCTAADNVFAASAAYIEGRPLPSDQMKIAACELIHVYVTRFAEEIMPFVGDCSKALLVTLQNSTQDELVASVMVCLAAVANVIWGPEVDPFHDVPEVLGFLCREAIVKNITLRPDDVEDAQDEPLQFFREDLEGMQRGARREGAATLVKALMSHHEKDVCPFLLETIKWMLNGDPNDTPAKRLLSKEAAIFLVMAISVKSSTRAKGVTEVNPQIPVKDFLRLEILPALTQRGESEHLTEMQLVRGAALKFVCLFRRFLAPEEVQHFVPIMAEHIASPSVLVSTHAAVTLERFLTFKGPNEPFLNYQDPKTIQYLSSAIKPLMIQMRSSDNEYVMRCLWRLLALVPGDVGTQAAQLKDLVSMLKQVALKPANPTFCHYLFEAVGALSRIVAVGVGVSDTALEVHHFVLDSMTAIITHEEGHSFVPYAYQIVAVMLGTLPRQPVAAEQVAAWRQMYVGLFEGVLKEDRWKVSISNIPGILQLLNVFLERPWVVGDSLQNHSRQLLTLFNFCLTARRIPVRMVFEYVNHIVVWMPADLLKVFATPLTQCLMAYLARAAQRSEMLAVQCAVISLGGLMIKCNKLITGGAIGWDQAPKPPAELDVPRLINAVQPLQTYIETFVTKVLAEVKFPQDKMVLAGMSKSMVSHPTVLELVQPAALEELKKNTLVSAGLLKDAEQEVRRTAVQDTTTVEAAREKLLAAVATEDDRGFADLSQSYNRLATVPDTSLRETILVTLINSF